MSKIKKRERRAKCIFGAGVCLLLFNFVFCMIATRIIPIDCVYCRKRITNISYLESMSGPWRDIPCFHPGCQDYVCNFLAPNCGLTMGEWLEIRGWNPRPEETRGKNWLEIVE